MWRRLHSTRRCIGSAPRRSWGVSVQLRRVPVSGTQAVVVPGADHVVVQVMLEAVNAETLGARLELPTPMTAEVLETAVGADGKARLMRSRGESPAKWRHRTGAAEEGLLTALGVEARASLVRLGLASCCTRTRTHGSSAPRALKAKVGSFAGSSRSPSSFLVAWVPRDPCASITSVLIEFALISVILGTLTNIRNVGLSARRWKMLSPPSCVDYSVVW